MSKSDPPSDGCNYSTSVGLDQRTCCRVGPLLNHWFLLGLAGMTVHAFLCYFVLFQAGDQEVRYVGTSTRRKRLSFDFHNLAKQKKSSLKLSRCLYFSLIATGSDAGSAGSTGSIFGGSGNTGQKRQVIRVQKEPSHKKGWSCFTFGLSMAPCWTETVSRLCLGSFSTIESRWVNIVTTDFKGGLGQWRNCHVVKMLSMFSLCIAWVGSWWFMFQVAVTSLPLGQAGLGMRPAMQIGHGTISAFSTFKKETSQYHTNGWQVSWLVVLYLVLLYDCCPFFVSLAIFVGFKRKYIWRSTADVKKWPSQWWMQCNYS